MVGAEDAITARYGPFKEQVRPHAIADVAIRRTSDVPAEVGHGAGWLATRLSGSSSIDVATSDSCEIHAVLGARGGSAEEALTALWPSSFS